MTDINTTTQPPLLAPTSTQPEFVKYPPLTPQHQQQQQQQPSCYKGPPMDSMGSATMMDSCSGTATPSMHTPRNLSLVKLAACARKRTNSKCELPMKAKKSLLKAALSLTRSTQSCCGHTTSSSMVAEMTHRPKKSVSFSTIACVSTRPISQEELNETWIQPEEYSEIERERRRTIHAIKATQGDLSRLDTSEHCVFGLEHQLCSRQVLSRKLKNLQYKKLLLEEQSIQRHYGVKDPEALQRLSQLFSQQATKRAHLRACMDSALASSPL